MIATMQHLEFIALERIEPKTVETIFANVNGV